MIRNIASPLAMIAVLGLVSCDSPPPTAPTTAATAGAAIVSESQFSKPDTSARAVDP